MWECTIVKSNRSWSTSDWKANMWKAKRLKKTCHRHMFHEGHHPSSITTWQNIGFLTLLKALLILQTNLLGENQMIKYLITVTTYWSKSGLQRAPPHPLKWLRREPASECVTPKCKNMTPECKEIALLVEYRYIYTHTPFGSQHTIVLLEKNLLQHDTWTAEAMLCWPCIGHKCARCSEITGRCCNLVSRYESQMSTLFIPHYCRTILCVGGVQKWRMTAWPCYTC